jgi:hypothetical protein
MTEPDDLTPLLVPPSATPDPIRRQARLRKTAGVIRRRRWVRRGVIGVAAVALFAAGGVVGWVAKPTPVVPPLVVPPEPETPVAPPPPAEPQSAEKLELLAELADDPTTAARLYREAGDRFLTDRDYENAARCYRRHLSVADADTQRVNSSDSWMLHTMKVR